MRLFALVAAATLVTAGLSAAPAAARPGHNHGWHGRGHGHGWHGNHHRRVRRCW